MTAHSLTIIVDDERENDFDQNGSDNDPDYESVDNRMSTMQTIDSKRKKKTKFNLTSKHEIGYRTV
jgi:hypothetical protein